MSSLLVRFSPPPFPRERRFSHRSRCRRLLQLLSVLPPLTPLFSRFSTAQRSAILHIPPTPRRSRRRLLEGPIMYRLLITCNELC